ncbi:MAG: YqaA family protein [Nitrososphaerales archaeon]
MVEITELFPFDESIGYVGLFTVSFVVSALVFIPAPFFVLLAAMSLDPEFDPHLLALTSAVGAMGGKMVVFYGSYYGRRILPKETKRRMRPLQKLVSRYGWPAAFIAAATPVPDDLVYIPLGLSKYNPMRFLIATLAGKIVLAEAIVWGTKAGLSSSIEPVLESVKDPALLYTSAFILAVGMGVVIYYTVKIDWTKSIGRWFPWTVEDAADDEAGRGGEEGKGRTGKDDDGNDDKPSTA